MKFDQSHFCTGKSSPYIGSKIPKMLALICFQNKESLPPTTFLFHFPFFLGKTTQLDVTTKFNGFQLATQRHFFPPHPPLLFLTPPRLPRGRFTWDKTKRSLDFLHSKGEGNILRKHIPAINISKWIKGMKKGKGHPDGCCHVCCFQYFNDFHLSRLPSKATFSEINPNVAATPSPTMSPTMVQATVIDPQVVGIKPRARIVDFQWFFKPKKFIH